VVKTYQFLLTAIRAPQEVNPICHTFASGDANLVPAQTRPSSARLKDANLTLQTLRWTAGTSCGSSPSPCWACSPAPCRGWRRRRGCTIEYVPADAAVLHFTASLSGLPALLARSVGIVMRFSVELRCRQSAGLAFLRTIHRSRGSVSCHRPPASIPRRSRPSCGSCAVRAPVTATLRRGCWRCCTAGAIRCSARKHALLHCSMGARVTIFQGMGPEPRKRLSPQNPNLAPGACIP